MLMGAPTSAVAAGLWGFNPALTSLAVRNTTLMPRVQMDRAHTRGNPGKGCHLYRLIGRIPGGTRENDAACTDG